MSFIVVMKGPVAKAGSILNLFKNNGIKVPNNEAINITVNNAELTVRVSSNDELKIMLYTNIKDEKSTALIKAIDNSFHNFFHVE